MNEDCCFQQYVESYNEAGDHYHTALPDKTVSRESFRPAEGEKEFYKPAIDHHRVVCLAQ
jgi:hypothetical protein